MKNTILLILFLSIFTSIGLCQNINTGTNKLSDIGADGGLGQISFGFCNQSTTSPSKSINTAITQGKPFEVCVIWKNGSNQDLELTVDLPYATYTAQGDKTCGKDTSFINFTQGAEDLQNTIIPAGNYLIKKFNITFPIGIQGKQEGCLVYNIKSSSFQKGQSGLMPRIRKGFFMNFFVGGAEDIKNEISIINTQTTTNNNKELILSFDIDNIGNIENEISITGYISNIFGFYKEFKMSSGIIIPERKLHEDINLGQLPTYGGIFNINFTTQASPHFIYDISDSNINPDILKTKKITTKHKHFQIPRLLGSMGIIIILLLMFSFKKKKTTNN